MVAFCVCIAFCCSLGGIDGTKLDDLCLLRQSRRAMPHASRHMGFSSHAGLHRPLLWKRSTGLRETIASLVLL